MSTLTITRGLPASGKTSWAKAWVAADPTTRARINRDDFRAMMFDTPDYSWPQEQAVTEASRTAVKALLAAGRDVVADDMNLRPKYVREWARFAAANGADFDVFELPCSPEESIERDAARERTVGEDMIRRMVERYTRKGVLLEVPDDVFDVEESVAPYVAKPGTTAAVIVDLDGTLCLHNGRSPYDIEQCDRDLLSQPVAEAVWAAYQDGAAVIYCSGREDRVLDKTREWLDKHDLPGGPLHMRQDGDKRKDSIVKRELFDAHIRNDYDVRYVLDDRNQVVQMWRELGLTVFQVADGDF
ncbi:MAG: hypothetical protein JWP74_1734 [Marmoricola sp.]|nr:hypothetical protein [Marmoricola sp.]